MPFPWALSSTNTKAPGFQGGCISRSPSQPADCSGDSCFTYTEEFGEWWPANWGHGGLVEAVVEALGLPFSPPHPGVITQLPQAAACGCPKTAHPPLPARTGIEWLQFATLDCVGSYPTPGLANFL